MHMVAPLHKPAPHRMCRNKTASGLKQAGSETYACTCALPCKHVSVSQAAVERKPATESAPSDTAETFDITKDKHRGQYALRRLYHESTRPIAVLYTSPTCGPCRSLKPIFNSVLDQYAGKVHYVEIDIEQDPEIAEAAGVNGTPTMQLFKDKERVANLPGVKQKSQYRELIESALESAKVPA